MAIGVSNSYLLENRNARDVAEQLRKLLRGRTVTLFEGSDRTFGVLISSVEALMMRGHLAERTPPIDRIAIMHADPHGVLFLLVGLDRIQSITDTEVSFLRSGDEHKLVRLTIE